MEELDACMIQESAEISPQDPQAGAAQSDPRFPTLASLQPAPSPEPVSSNPSPLRPSCLQEQDMPLDIQQAYLDCMQLGDPYVGSQIKEYLLDSRNDTWDPLRRSLAAHRTHLSSMQIRQQQGEAPEPAFAHEPFSALRGPPHADITMRLTSPPVLQLHLHSICNGIGTSTQALLRAAGILEAQGIARVRICFEDIYEMDPVSNAIADSMTSATWPRRHNGDMQWLPRQVASTKLAHIPFLVSGTPCEKLSQGTLWSTYEDRGLVGPHAYPSNLCHTMHAAILKLLKSNRVFLSLAEMVIPALKEWTQELTLLWGWATEIKAELWGGARRDRLYFTIPPIGPLEIFGKAPTGNLPGGWLWPLPRHHNCKVPNTIRAMTPELARRAVAQTLTATERTNLSELRTYHFEIGDTLPSVTSIAAWMGWKEEDARNLQALHPCLKPPSRSVDGSRRVDFCGHEVYCTNCEILVSRLGKAWHIEASVSVVHSLIRSFVSPSTVRKVTLIAHEHKCPRECEHVITRLEARGRRACPQAFQPPPLWNFELLRPAEQ